MRGQAGPASRRLSASRGPAGHSQAHAVPQGPPARRALPLRRAQHALRAAPAFCPSSGPRPRSPMLGFYRPGCRLLTPTRFDAVPRDQSDRPLARRPRHRNPLSRRPRQSTPPVPAPWAQASGGNSSRGGGAPVRPGHASHLPI